MGARQPMLGSIATALVMAVSLAFISFFSYPVFANWVAFLLICGIPMQIVIGITWKCEQPRFAGSRSQPMKGILLTLVTLVVGSVVAIVHFNAFGKVSPPPPMAAMCIITSVIVTFWGTIMMGGWPFTSLFNHQVTAGLSLLAACYAINYLLFRLFFNYDFMKGAPVYVPADDPHGLFNGWYSLVFFVTFSAVMFLMVNFDLWPLSKFPALMKQPVLGVVWTAIVLVLTGAVFYLGVYAAGMDIAAFMIRVPIPFIFGTIVVLNMMHHSLFAKVAQPLKGVLNTVTAAVIGTALALGYGAVAPLVSGTVKPGPPAYDFEIWLASALLAVTFPFLIYYAEFFQMWPLHRAEPAAERAKVAVAAGD